VSGAEPMEATILVVEDDRSLREGLAMNFRRWGYRVLVAEDGEEGMDMAFETQPDLIVLDIMLPGFTGLDILDELRSREVDTPVLVLSARGRLDQRVEGLKLGADDYLAKPFELPELLARVEALLRRTKGRDKRIPPIAFGEISVDIASRAVTRAGKSVELSGREFDLLLLFARSPGRCFSRAQLIERVWGWDFEGTERTVDNFILALRRKLEVEPGKPRHLKTVRQVGYRLDL
jgi:two-component system, OmpR family, alkaline phosphatase synthesis response regulator PhoP